MHNKICEEMERCPDVFITDFVLIFLFVTLGGFQIII